MIDKRGRYVLNNMESVRVTAVGHDTLLYGWYNNVVPLVWHPDGRRWFDGTWHSGGWALHCKADDKSALSELIPWVWFNNDVASIGKGALGWYCFGWDRLLMKDRSKVIVLPSVLNLPDADTGVILDRPEGL